MQNTSRIQNNKSANPFHLLITIYVLSLYFAGRGAVGAVCYTEPALGEGKIKVSLRSIGDFDTTAISQQYGGGGHKNASSFNVDKAVFESWRV